MPQTIPNGNVVVRRFGRMTLKLLALVGRVRPDERRDVLGAFVTLLAFMAGHALLETARDALFLASLPARRLPWVYLAIAVIALAIGHREPRVVRRLSARNELSRWLLAAAVVTSLFWLVVGREADWVLYALYVWSGVIASLVVVRFWTVLGSRFTVTQAKRVFPVIASGSVVGAIFGSGLARLVTAVLDPRHLVLVAAAAFFAASTGPALLDVADTDAPRRRNQWSDLGDVGRAIWSRPYLRRVALLVLLATVTFTLVDYVFKSTADRLVAPDDLGEFFASVYLAFNITSLFMQVLVVGWLLRNFGLVSAVVFIPATLLVATLGFAVGGGLTLALVLKGTDGTFRHSLFRTGTELLFVPLSDRLRTQVKGVIDVLGQRGGQALASIVILMLLSTPVTETTFAVLACLTTVGWLIVASGIREPYLDLFRETLHKESAPPGGAFAALDTASIETLVATLNAPDDRRVVAALDLLESQGRGDAVPGTVLYHPSPAVVVRAMDVLVAARREDILEVLPRLLGHVDGDVRAAGVRAVSALAPSRTAFRDALRDPDPRVVTTSRAALVACGWDEEGVHGRALADESLFAPEGVQVALAKALRVRAAPELEPVLLNLLAHHDARVLRVAIPAAREMRTPGLVDPLITLLGRRAVRDDARAAVVRYGSLALSRLADVLDDRQAPHHVRSHVPGTIALVGSAQAPAILLRHLQSEPDGLIRFKILRALGRWRKEQPAFPLDVGQLQDALSHAVSTAFRLMGWRRMLEASMRKAPALRTELHDVLQALLRDKQDHALERAFRLLYLQSGSDEFQRVYRGLHSPLPASRAGSRELLSHMVVPPVREPLMTLVDDLHGEGGPRRSGLGGDRNPSGPYAAVLSEIVGCGMESASSIAAIHAAELGLDAVLPAIEAALPLSAEHERTLGRARRALGSGAAA